MEFDRFQEEVGNWAYENFGGEEEYRNRLVNAENADSVMPLLGIEEELGELIHSVLKQIDGIREDEEGVGKEAEKDAIGDILIFLAHFCERRDIEMSECIEKAWEENVKERDWKEKK